MRQRARSYTEALEGPPEKRLRDITMLLRDKLSQLCFDLELHVKAMDPALISSLPGTTALKKVSYCHSPGAEEDYMGILKTKAVNFTEYYSGAPPIELGIPRTTFINVPIGYYGEQFARQLAMATGTLLWVCHERLDASISRTHSANRELMRGNTSLNDPYRTMMDGILSVKDAYSLLMAERLPGFDEPLACMDALHRAGMLNQLSMLTRFGFLGPATRMGIYVKGLVSVSKTDRFRLDRDFVNTMERHRRNPNSGINRYTEGCPVGRRMEDESQTGVEAVTEAFIHAFRALSYGPSGSALATKYRHS